MDTDMLSKAVNNSFYVDAKDPIRKNEEIEGADAKIFR
jgi:hypothetical protein